MDPTHPTPFDSRQYDECWNSQWDDMKRYGPFARHLRRIIHSLIDGLEFNSVLDVGCGQGALLSEIHQHQPRAKLHGVELSPAAVALAQKRIPQATFETLDLSKSSLATRFDLIICSEVLEHIEEDRAAIANLRAMAKRYLIVSSPQGRMRSIESRYGHVRNYQSGELQKKLEESGFVVRKVIEWGFPFYSPLYRDLMNMTGAPATEGKYGTAQKIIAQLIYGLFCFNSHHRGDELVILCEASN